MKGKFFGAIALTKNLIRKHMPPLIIEHTFYCTVIAKCMTLVRPRGTLSYRSKQNPMTLHHPINENRRYYLCDSVSIFCKKKRVNTAAHLFIFKTPP